MPGFDVDLFWRRAGRPLGDAAGSPYIAGHPTESSLQAHEEPS
jgi:hypothetical protein